MRKWYVSFDECAFSDRILNTSYHSLGIWSDESAEVLSKRMGFDLFRHESVEEINSIH